MAKNNMFPRKTVQTQTLIWVRRLMFIASLIGLFASIYLLITYTSGKPIVCGTSHGCDIVRSSEWAYLGPIPRPALGVLFYAGFIGWLLYRLAFAKKAWQKILLELTWVGAFIGFAESAWLFYVQAALIKAFCTWCLTSGAAALILFLSSFFDSAEELDERTVSKEIRWIFKSVLIAFVGGTILLWGLIYRDAGGDQPSIKQQGMNVPVVELVPAGTPIEGPATATVTLVEFLDFECPGCAAYHPIIQQIRQEFTGQIKYVQRLMPLVEIHKHARASAIAAVCAQEQGKYFEMADALIANRTNLERSDLEHYADALRLDATRFKTCLDDPAMGSRVDAARKAGDAMGITQTPTLFLNDEELSDLPSLETLRSLIKARL